MGTSEITGSQSEPWLEIEVSQDAEGIEAGSHPSLICRMSEPGQLVWLSPGRNLTIVRELKQIVRLDLKPARRSDTGNYTCRAKTDSGKSLEKTIQIRVIGEKRNHLIIYISFYKLLPNSKICY